MECNICFGIPNPPQLFQCVQKCNCYYCLHCYVDIANKVKNRCAYCRGILTNQSIENFHPPHIGWQLVWDNILYLFECIKFFFLETKRIITLIVNDICHCTPKIIYGVGNAFYHIITSPYRLFTLSIPKIKEIGKQTFRMINRNKMNICIIISAMIILLMCVLYFDISQLLISGGLTIPIIFCYLNFQHKPSYKQRSKCRNIQIRNKYNQKQNRNIRKKKRRR